MLVFLSLTRFQKQLIASACDLVFLPLTFIVAVLMRYDGLSPELARDYLWLIVATPVVSIPVFIKLGLYRAVIRFIDQKIVYLVLVGVTISVVSLAALSSFLHLHSVSRGVFVIYWISAILYVVASRFLARGYLLHAAGHGGAIRVAIYGAGMAGTQLVGALRSVYEYLPVAFIDDKKELQGATISGIKVYPPTKLPALVAKHKVQEILLAMPSATKAQQKRVLEQLEPLKVKIRVTPSIKSLVSGGLRLDDVRDIEIEDLLGRDIVAPDARLISACIVNQNVMVTGAGGSIGSELCRQVLLQKPARLLLFDVSEFSLYTMEQELLSTKAALGLATEIIPFLGSVLEQEKCQRIFRVYAVDTIYHAAAYKHVPLVEHNPLDGIRNNVFGTLRVAQAAMAEKVKCFVLVSTDKAVRPTNVMGSTKRLAELVLQAFSRQQRKTRFCMVRFGNVLGSSGSVVPLFRKQIMAGGPITLTHPEITRYFMTIPEAAQLVLQAGAMGEGGDVFVLDMGEPVKIIDLAKRMVHLSGLEVRSDSTPDGTIEIQHVGLRPGEKLYEELLIGSNVEGTGHPLILRAQEVELPWASLEKLLVRLEDACNRFDVETMREVLLQALPEYEPQCGIEDFLWVAQNGRLNAIDERQRLALVNRPAGSRTL
ncbi:MAG: wbpM [Herminiimonas sp.]|nr:wbpM [Herminiimonas sp.]